MPEPWRQYVRQALTSRQRFDQSVAQWPAGPLHDRLVIIQPRLAQATEEVWAGGPAGRRPGRLHRRRDGRGDGSARVGDPFQGVAAHPGRAPAHRRHRIGQRRWPDPRRPSPPSSGPLAGRRRPRGEVLDRLRLLTARLDEAVTELLELGLEPAGRPIEGPAAEATFGSVDALVEEIGALHQGLREAGEAASGAGEAAGAPGLPAGSDGAEPGTRLPASPAGTPRPTGRAVCRPATRAPTSGRTAVTTDHAVACRPWE